VGFERSSADMKKTTNIDSGFVCHCARIRHSELLEIFSESSDPSYENFKRQYGIGGQCASCEYEVQAILDEYIGSRGPGIIKMPRPSLRQRLLERGSDFRGWLKKLLPQQKAAASATVAPKVNYRACMFFVLRKALQSSIVVSNINNPESNINPNNGTGLFRVLIYDSSGRLVVQTQQIKVRPNETKELFATDLFDNPPDDLVGSTYVEYYDLVATNTLRPYCVLNYFGPEGILRSRQHYHDKLYTGTIPGFVQSPSTLMPRRVLGGNGELRNAGIRRRAFFSNRGGNQTSVAALFASPERISIHLGLVWRERPGSRNDGPFLD
jgi:bacterioferritin-associated ferredoxin